MKPQYIVKKIEGKEASIQLAAVDVIKTTELAVIPQFFTFWNTNRLGEVAENAKTLSTIIAVITGCFPMLCLPFRH